MEEKLAKLALKSYLRVDAPPKQTKKYRKMNSQLAALKISYANRTRNIENYWKAVAAVTDI